MRKLLTTILLALSVSASVAAQTVHLRADGTYSDCVATGNTYTWVWSTFGGQVVAESPAGTELWRVGGPRMLLKLRAGWDGTHVLAMGQESDPNGGSAWLTVNGAPLYRSGLMLAASAFDGPTAYIVRPDRVERVDAPTGQVLGDAGFPPSAAGIADIVNGEVRMAVDWFARTGPVTVFHPAERGGVTVGEFGGGGVPEQIAGFKGQNAFTALLGTAFEPHIAALADGRYIVCARTPAGAALVEIPPYQPLVLGSQPPPAPTPDPVPQNPQLPDAICEALKNERAKYPAVADDSFIGKMLNDVTFQFAHYGLSGKAGGHNCATAAGLIACDIIQRDDLFAWDVVQGNEAGTIICGESIGKITDSSRPFVLPVKRVELPEPGTPPDGLDALRKRIAALEMELALMKIDEAKLLTLVNTATARIGELETERDALKVTLATTQAARETAEARVRELENRPPPSCEAKVPAVLRGLGIKIGCIIK